MGTDLKQPATAAQLDPLVGPHDLITVCDACLQASCWQCEFMCDDSRSAGTVQMKRSDLEAKHLEHPSWLKTDDVLAKG